MIDISECHEAECWKHGEKEPCPKCAPAMTLSEQIEAIDDEDCSNCGGEGFTYGCSWDWQCDTYDEGEGTCLCQRRCEWCQGERT